MVSAALAAACRIVCSAARDKWFHTPMKVSSVERSFRSAGERRCRIFGASITDSLHSEIPLTEDQHVTRSRAGRPSHVPTDETRNLAGDALRLRLLVGLATMGRHQLTNFKAQ